MKKTTQDHWFLMGILSFCVTPVVLVKLGVASGIVGAWAGLDGITLTMMGFIFGGYFIAEKFFHSGEWGMGIGFILGILLGRSIIGKLILG